MRNPEPKKGTKERVEMEMHIEYLDEGKIGTILLEVYGYKKQRSINNRKGKQNLQGLQHPRYLLSSISGGHADRSDCFICQWAFLKLLFLFCSSLSLP